jgi:hypothetical protein
MPIPKCFRSRRWQNASPEAKAAELVRLRGVAREMRIEGVTDEDIARKIGLRRETVQRWFRMDCGIQSPRKPKEGPASRLMGFYEVGQYRCKGCESTVKLRPCAICAARQALVKEAV